MVGASKHYLVIVRRIGHMYKTVYILGAGSSRAATSKEKLPTPLATDFFKPSYLNEYWYDLDFGGEFNKSPLYFILSRYFASDAKSGESIEMADINIEEVYSFLHSYDRVFQSSSHRQWDFETARRQLQKYIITVVRYSSWSLKSQGYLNKLVSKIGPSDTIITFNWDTLIEQALQKSERSACKNLLNSNHDLIESMHTHAKSTGEERYERLHKGRLIKVHGSVNHTVCVNHGCRRNNVPYIWELKEESPEYWPCLECGSPTEVMILAPHGAKTYSASNFFKSQASLAAQAISLASRLVIVGYSVPVFDIEARSMLRCARLDDDDSEAWLEEVIVVDPQTDNTKFINEFRNLIGVDNHGAHGHPVSLKTHSDVRSYERAKYT